MCVIFQPILRLFLVMISTEACRVSLGIVPSCTYKRRRRRATYLSDYPTPAGHSLATVWMVWWLLTRLLIFCIFTFFVFSSSSKNTYCIKEAMDTSCDCACYDQA